MIVAPFALCVLDKTTKKPVFAPNEIEMVVQEGTNILDSNKEELYEDGVMRLTTHAVYWVDNSHKVSVALSHAKVHSVEEHASGWMHKKVYHFTIMYIMNNNFNAHNNA